MVKKALICIGSFIVATVVAVSVYFGTSQQSKSTSSSQTDAPLTTYASGYDKKEEIHGLSETSRYGSYFKQTNGYQNLDQPAMQQLYHEIEKDANQISYDKNENGSYKLQKIIVNQRMTSSEICKALVAFQDDHPNIFWFSNAYQYAITDTQSEIQLFSYVSPDQCLDMQAKLNRKLDEIILKIPGGLSEMDRELAVCKIIEDTCVYDNIVAEHTDLWESYTVYGALLNGKAVCQGYAKSVQLLLSYMNMECQLVNGNAGGMLHMWNLVQVDGNWYHLDVTWIDNQNIPAYQYFNLTDKQIMYDHTISPNYSECTNQQLSSGAVFNLNLPSCVSDAENYMQQTQIVINGTDSVYDKEIVDAIVKKVEFGENILCFTVNISLDFNDTISQMFQKPPFKFIDYIKAANKQLSSDKRLEYTNCKYTVDKFRRYIMVKIAFEQ